MYDIGEGKPLYEWIDEHVIVNQSLEATEMGGFHFVGSALLTKDTLPGIPLSRIFPLEHVVSEALSASQKINGKTVKIQIKGLTNMSEGYSKLPSWSTLGREQRRLRARRRYRQNPRGNKR